MEICLRLKSWRELRGYADALERYTASEPLPWSDFFIARARALAEIGQVGWSTPLQRQLQDLAETARRSGQLNALPALDEALVKG